MMPPSSKKQKLDNALDISGLGVQRGIRAFGTISKPLSNRNKPEKSRLDGSKRVVDQGLEKASLIGVNGLKRKREESLPEHSSIEEDLVGPGDCGLSSQAEPQNGCQLENTVNERELSPLLLQLARKQQPSNTREKAQRSSHSNHISTQSGRPCCLESFPLEPSSPSDLNVTSSLSSSEALGTPHPSILPIKNLSSHPRCGNTPDDRPGGLDELHDLIDLYSSFLTALSLHYAHNGWPTPADLRALRPSVERSWRRKRVSTDDVRRILGIAQVISAGSDQDEGKPGGLSDLSLIDYGNGKICIEMDADLQCQGLFQKRLLDEEALNRRFAKNLLRRWKTYRESCKSTSTTAASAAAAGAFISQLPLASITLCPSIRKISPLLAKGQRRLEDLKAGAIRAQQKNSSSPPIQPCPNGSPQKTPATAAATTTRNDSLLSRIRAKQQLHQSTLSLSSDTETHQASILRKSALQRLQEIIPVLEILTTTTTTSAPFSTSRCNSNSNSNSTSNSHSEPSLQTGSCRTYSYTMPSIVQHLQTSLRNPIAKDDAVRCVRLLASEVAPEWVRVREVGKVVGVTVRKGDRGLVGRGDLMGRVEELLRAC